MGAFFLWVCAESGCPAASLPAMLPFFPVAAVILGLIAARDGWSPLPLAAVALLFRRRGIALLLIIAWIQGLGYGWTTSIKYWTLPPWASDIQDQALALLSHGLPSELGRLLGGMLLGRSAAGFGLHSYPHWTDAGMVHLLVASGAQVTLLTFPLVWTLHHLDLAPRFRRLLGLGILMQLGLVLVLTGLDPSILRAATLAAWLLLGLALGHPTLALYGLVRVAAFWLLLDPDLLTNASFQLSYAATLGLLTLTPLWERHLPTQWPVPLRYVALLALATCAAQCAVMPVLWCRFGRVEVIGLVTNIVAVPLSEMVIWTGVSKSLLLWLGWPVDLLNSCLLLLLGTLDGLACWGSQYTLPSAGPLDPVVGVTWLLTLALVPQILSLWRQSWQRSATGLPTLGWALKKAQTDP